LYADKRVRSLAHARLCSVDAGAKSASNQESDTGKHSTVVTSATITTHQNDKSLEYGINGNSNEFGNCTAFLLLGADIREETGVVTRPRLVTFARRFVLGNV
jgi:hypothetical protein